MFVCDNSKASHHGTVKVLLSLVDTNLIRLLSKGNQIKSNQINCKTFTWKHFNENIVYALRYLISNVFFLRLYPLLVRSRLLKWSNVSKTGGFCKSACVWWPWKWSVGKAWCLKLRTAWPTSTLARSSPQHLRTRESESGNVTSFLSPSGSGSGSLTLGNNWKI